MARLKLLVFSALMLISVPSFAARAVMEGIAASSNTIMVDTTTIRVGIGVSTPAYRLDVYGDIRATGTIYGTLSAGMAPGDNLGNHIATQAVNMNTFGINNVSFLYNDGSVGYAIGQLYAILNGTQTFSAPNTFTNSNSFSGTNTFSSNLLASSVTVSSTDGIMISTFSRTSSGFTYLPGGILLEWGQTAIAGAHATQYTISFPKQFPTAIFQVLAYIGETVSTAVTTVSCPRVSASTSSFICQFGSLTGGTYASTIHWMAIGY